MATMSFWPAKRLDKVCPVCKQEARSYTYRGDHCNGSPFEYVEYGCGALLEYSPNFERMMVQRPCPNSATAKAEAARRQKIAEHTVRGIATIHHDRDIEAVMAGLSIDLRDMVSKHKTLFLETQRQAREKT